MALQNYTPMRLAPTADPILRNELLKVDIFLRQLTPFAGRVPVFPQGSTAATIDLNQFLFLPGRVPEQRAFGTVVYSGKSADEASALDDSIYRGLTLKGTDDTGLQRITHTVYFQPDNVAGASIVRKWIFPSISSSPTDTFTFASTTGTQTFSGKTITSGTIWVGTNATSNTFRSSTNPTAQEFTISPNTGFPAINDPFQTKPTLRLPSLDLSTPSTDRHTFMMLHASTTAPFTSGSIAHGNHDGSEMQMLPAGGNGRVLRFNVGETVAGTSWASGGTVITGVFDTTKTRSGMRIRGNSGTSIYVDENTMVVSVTATTITVDTPLVGSNAGVVTIQTWGPTWDFEATLDHGTLTGLLDDDHPQYLYLPGRAGGQTLGVLSHTGGNLQDLAVEGRMLIGDGLFGVNYTAGRAMDIRQQMSNNVSLVFLSNTSGLPGGAASGTLRMIQIQGNTVGYAAGSYTFRGMDFLMAGVASPSGVTALAVTPLFIQCTPGESGDPGSGGAFGSITAYRGAEFNIQGTNNPASRAISVTTTISSTAITSAGLFVAPIAAGQVVSGTNIPERTTLTSITDASNAVISQAATGSGTNTITFRPISTELILNRMLGAARGKPFTTASFIQVNNVAGGNDYIVNANILEVSATPPFNTTGITTWSLINMPTTLTLPGTTWMLNIVAVNNSRHAGNFSIGSTETPTAKVHLGAGTIAATTAPLKYTSGALMTSAEAGAMEHYLDGFYVTPTSTVVRQQIATDLNVVCADGEVVTSDDDLVLV